MRTKHPVTQQFTVPDEAEAAVRLQGAVESVSRWPHRGHGRSVRLRWRGRSRHPPGSARCRSRETPDHRHALRDAPQGIERPANPRRFESRLDGFSRPEVASRGSGTLRRTHCVAMKPTASLMQDSHRLRVLAFAILQSSALVAIPAADALLDARGLGTAVHLDGEGGGHCDPGHSHLHCQLVRALSLGVVRSDVHPLLRPVTDLGAVPASRNASASSPVLSGGRGPRAPPPA